MITQGMCNSFKQELLKADHDFDVDTFKLALYTENASLTADTTVYSASNEVVASGYTAGGAVLTGVSVALSGGVAYVSFANTQWSGAFTSRGGLIYNASKSNKAVAVLDFGASKTSSTLFQVTMPAAAATTALIRIG